MKISKAILLILACGAVLLSTGCADSVDFSKAAEMEVVGFWYGLWHGWIIFFSWIGSLFSENIAVYAVYNNGGWYDFGFILGLGVLIRTTYKSTNKRKKYEMDRNNCVNLQSH